MTDRVFEDYNSFDVSDRHGGLEVYVFDAVKPIDERGGTIMISVTEDRTNNAKLSREEATALKEFLIKQGY